MALTEAQKQELLAVLGRTGGHRETMKKVREIPEGYQKMLEQIDLYGLYALGAIP